jgi:hypothetical protein
VLQTRFSKGHRVASERVSFELEPDNAGVRRDIDLRGRILAMWPLLDFFVTSTHKHHLLMDSLSIAGVEYSVTASSINEAKQLFKSATNRLLSIGEWNRFCSGLSAIFRLSDHTGRILNRKARPHDLFRIDRSNALDENNLLEVSKLVTFKKASGKSESIAIEVRPPDNTNNEGVGLFEIKRYNNVVTAIVHDPAEPGIKRKLAFISPVEWRSLFTRILS